MITMKGAAVSAKLKEQVEKGLETLTWVPKLTIIRVGENPDDISYEKGATKKLTSFGLEVESKVRRIASNCKNFASEFSRTRHLRGSLRRSMRMRRWTVF